MDVTVIEVITEQQMLAAFQIRKEVFSDEQGVPPELERDAHDEKATHLLANTQETPIGAARVRHIPGAGYKIERVSILRKYRGLGMGKILFRKILMRLKSQGANRIYIHAQTATIPFYEKLGLVAEGPIFEEAGISHRKMVVELNEIHK